MSQQDSNVTGAASSTEAEPSRIASHIGSKPFHAACQKDPRVGEMHFWCLEVTEDRSAVLSARADSGVQPFITQNIPFTDFPLAKIDTWAAYDGMHWTLYLPSEH